MNTSTTTPHSTQVGEAAVQVWLRSQAANLGVEANELTLDAVRVGEVIQVVLLDNQSGTIRRLEPSNEASLFTRFRDLLKGGAKAVTITSSRIRYLQAPAEP